MRVGTWNLAGRGGQAQRRLLEGLDCDVLLLTEVPLRLVLEGYNDVRAALMGPDKHFAAVLARTDLEQVPSPHPATAAARVSDRLFLSTVLPWRSAVSEPWVGQDLASRFTAAVDDLVPLLQRDPRVVWGGDLNCTLSGPLHGSSRAGRAHLERALQQLGLRVPTAQAPRGVYDMASIDHVAAADAHGVEHHPAVSHGRRLSDHDAYVVHLHGV